MGKESWGLLTALWREGRATQPQAQIADGPKGQASCGPVQGLLAPSNVAWISFLFEMVIFPCFLWKTWPLVSVFYLLLSLPSLPLFIRLFLLPSVLPSQRKCEEFVTYDLNPKSHSPKSRRRYVSWRQFFVPYLFLVYFHTGSSSVISKPFML